MKKCRVNCFKSNKEKLYALAIAAGFICSTIASFAQDGVAGIQEANNKVRGYFDAGTNLMYAIGAIVGLVGAIKV